MNAPAVVTQYTSLTSTHYSTHYTVYIHVYTHFLCVSLSVRVAALECARPSHRVADRRRGV